MTAEFALVKAWKGDRWGNLVYRKTARNFNPMMATAGKITIAEVEHLVEPGELDPDHIHTPSVYVQRIFQGTDSRNASNAEQCGRHRKRLLTTETGAHGEEEIEKFRVLRASVVKL